MAADGLEGGQEKLTTIDVDALDDAFESCFGIDEVVVLLRQSAKAGFKLVEFGEGVEIDGADLINLVAEVGDFALDSFTRAGGGVFPVR